MHKKIGILGGLSPESTVAYYEHITRTYVSRYGDFGYPEILIYSVTFQQYVDWQRAGRWADAADAMALALRALHRAGADFGLISTNTMHKVFNEVQARVDMPLLSIVDSTAEALRRARIGAAGLLGTVFTMRESFYPQTLRDVGIDTVIPEFRAHERINEIIFGELCRGERRPESRRFLQGVIEDLGRRGARAVVLGCTELPLLIEQKDSPLPLFDTTALHAERALEYAINQEAHKCSADDSSSVPLQPPAVSSVHSRAATARR